MWSPGSECRRCRLRGVSVACPFAHGRASRPTWRRGSSWRPAKEHGPRVLSRTPGFCWSFLPHVTSRPHSGPGSAWRRVASAARGLGDRPAQESGGHGLAVPWDLGWHAGPGGRALVLSRTPADHGPPSLQPAREEAENLATGGGGRWGGGGGNVHPSLHAQLRVRDSR